MLMSLLISENYLGSIILSRSLWATICVVPLAMGLLFFLTHFRNGREMGIKFEFKVIYV